MIASSRKRLPCRTRILAPVVLFAALPILGVELRAEDYHLVLKGEKLFDFLYRDKQGELTGFTAGFERREHLRLDLSGNIGNRTKVSGTFEDAPTQEEPPTSRLEVENPAFRIRLGRFASDAGGTASALAGRTLDGGQVSVLRNNWSLTLLGSRAGGHARNERFLFQGAGEYRLEGAPLLSGSEQVFINRNRLTKDKDYRIDYLAGSILLTPDFLIEAKRNGYGVNDRLTVLYESNDDSMRPQILAGWLAYAPDSMRLVEISAIRQKGATQSSDSALYVGGGRLKWRIGRALEMAAQAQASAYGDSSIVSPALAGNGGIHLSLPALDMSGEADFREPAYADLSKTNALPGRELFAAGQAVIRPFTWLEGRSQASQEWFGISDSVNAIERAFAGALQITPLARFTLSGFASYDSLGNAPGSGSSMEIGARAEKDWDSYALDIFGRQKTSSMPLADSLERPVGVTLQTNRFHFMQTSTGVQYKQAWTRQGLRNDQAGIDYNVTLRKGKQRLLATGLAELHPKLPPVFQTSFNGSTEAGKARLSAAATQRYYSEAAADTGLSDSLASDTVFRPIDVHQMQFEAGSGYGVDANLSGRIRLGRSKGTAFLKESSLELAGTRDLLGAIKPEVSVGMDQFEQWDRNRYVPRKELERNQQRARAAIVLGKLGFVSSRISWSGKRDRDWQIPAADSLARIQDGTVQEYLVSADLAVSESFSFITEGTFSRENRNLQSGTADPDPFLHPTIEPGPQFRNVNASTYKADIKAVWQISALAQLSAGTGYSRRFDLVNVDGTPAELDVTQSLMPQAQGVVTLKPVEFGVSGSGSLSRGRYETRQMQAEPFFRVSVGEHVNAEARGRIEQSYRPYYRTIELSLNARIGF